MTGVLRFEQVEGLILDIDGTLFWGGNPVIALSGLLW
jgi:hypothetical protein